MITKCPTFALYVCLRVAAALANATAFIQVYRNAWCWKSTVQPARKVVSSRNAFCSTLVRWQYVAEAQQKDDDSVTVTLTRCIMGRNTTTAALVACAILVFYFPWQGDCGLPARRHEVVGDTSWSAMPWLNSFDEGLAFNCHGDNQAITGLYSEHDDYYEDRRFKIECRDLPRSPGQTWDSGYQNLYEHPVNFRCPSNYVMTGMQSHHTSDYEDRQWSFTCKPVFGYRWYDCYWTPYNALDGVSNVQTRVGYFFTGVRSHHYSWYLDRISSYRLCKLLTSSELTDLIQG
ncbi:Hypp1016 [Branchiostoma lanceolatum]|uniref:Hypp1016 protein n=1 Tax=Branchiostoma lanceolatum TaxID=7740 RepID=A0A8J9ZDW7_BRALA|nr:Hypp1016 [Branchiostoma lanceolatum]